MLFVYDKALALYRLSADHPLQPERFTLAVDLLGDWGLLDEADGPGSPPLRVAAVELPPPATEEDLLLAHSARYVEFVKHASRAPATAFGHGIGPGDTPAFPGMHEASALAAGASVSAVMAVAQGRDSRSCNLAGGLHHAAFDHASGFCVYNDVVVALRRALAAEKDLRIAYVDIDAHHGDGVEVAFVEEPRVLTVSVHESGRYLFPGSGDAEDVGRGAGIGTAVNLPLPPLAGPRSYMLAWSEVLLPALEAFAPDMIVLQGGADSHMNDPLTHLGQTVRGYVEIVGCVLDASRSLCGCRAVLLGGGGYRTYDEVPRMWAAAVAQWLDVPVPELLPRSWLDRSNETADRADGEGCSVERTLDEEEDPSEKWDSELVIDATEASIAQVRHSSPLLGGSAARGVHSLEEQLADLVDREIDAGF